jgi:1-acyl-sn-glycerol-3-phosphate acyltransferase
MLPAAKNRLGAAIVYYGLIRSGVASRFDGVYLKCVGPVPSPDDGPVIFYPNHPSWWDGHMCALLDRVAFKGRFDGYLMMEQAQLARYGFFRWLGVFAVDRGNARAAARSVAYIAEVLRQDPRRCCYMFPQGALTPADRRPITTFGGLAHIVKRVGSAVLCPVALRYELRGEQRPDAFIRVGPCERVAPPIHVGALTSHTAQQLTLACDALRDDVVSDRLHDYQLLVRGQPGTDRIFDRVMQLVRRA